VRAGQRRRSVVQEAPELVVVFVVVLVLICNGSHTANRPC